MAPESVKTVAIEVDRLNDMLASLEAMAGGDVSRRVEISPSRDVFDAIAFAINILADEVTFRYHELKSTQAQLIQSAKMAALGEFSSGIAHEINNPLTLVRLHVDQLVKLLAESGLPIEKELLAGLRKIDMNVDRMAKTVKHVQDFARPSSDVKCPVSLNDAVSSTLDLVSEQLRIKRIELELSLSEDRPHVEADIHSLEHVLLNLISNACDALDGREKPKITITSTTDRGYASIVVSDNGSGIDEAHIEKLFEPFFSTKPPGKGTGLGLSISYQIARAHDGSITCRSERDKGSEFTLMLPTVEPSAKSTR